MDNIVPIINAASSLILVLIFAYIAICAWTDKLHHRKQRSMQKLAQSAHVQVCDKFGYSPTTAISCYTLRSVLEALAEGRDPEIEYIASKDMVFNKDKTNGRP